MPFTIPTTETKLKRKLFAYLTRNYPTAYFRKLSDRFKAGIPDVFLCHRGHAIWIELKIHPKGLTPIQDREIEYIRAAGGNAEVLSTDGKRYWIGTTEYESLKEVVHALLKGANEL